MGEVLAVYVENGREGSRNVRKIVQWPSSVESSLEEQVPQADQGVFISIYHIPSRELPGDGNVLVWPLSPVPSTHSSWAGIQIGTQLVPSKH